MVFSYFPIVLCVHYKVEQVEKAKMDISIIFCVKSQLVG